MVKKLAQQRNYEEAVAWLRDHGFEILEPTGTHNRVFLKKNHVAAAIEKIDHDGVKLFAHPGYLVSGEISKLVDRGYQKFLRTSKTEIPATAEHLKAIHEFTEELKAALGLPSLYNESLGTVNDDHLYDRVAGRDQPAATRPKRPWQGVSPKSSKRRA